MARRLGDRRRTRLRPPLPHARAVGHRSGSGTTGRGNRARTRSPTTSATSSLHCTATCGGSASCWPKVTSTQSTKNWSGSKRGTPGRCTRSRRPTPSTSAAMMALIAGEIEQAEWMARRGMEVPRATTTSRPASTGRSWCGPGGSAASSVALEPMFHEVIGQADSRATRSSGRRWPSSTLRRASRTEAMADLEALARVGWEVVAKDQTEGVSLALAAAACGVLGARAAGPRVGSCTSRCGPMRARRSSSGRRPPRAWARPTTTSGCWPRPPATSPSPKCTSRRRSGWRNRMGSPPFEAASEVELARTLRQRGREGEEERVADPAAQRRGDCVALGPAPAGPDGGRPGLIRPAGVRQDRAGPLSSSRSAIAASLSSASRMRRLMPTKQCVAEARDLHHRFELTRPHDQHVEVRCRRHRRAARRRLDRRQLPEVVARAPLVDDSPGPGDDDGALENDEQLAPEPALAQDDLAVLDMQTLGDASDLCELLVRAGGEPRHAVQAFSHHWSSAPTVLCHPLLRCETWRQATRSHGSHDLGGIGNLCVDLAPARHALEQRPEARDLAMAANSRGPMISTSTALSAVTVACRGPGLVAMTRRRSCPGPGVDATPALVTATLPERIRKNSRPIRPSRARTSPLSTWTRSASRATSSSCARVQAPQLVDRLRRSTVA